MDIRHDGIESIVIVIRLCDTCQTELGITVIMLLTTDSKYVKRDPTRLTKSNNTQKRSPPYIYLVKTLTVQRNVTLTYIYKFKTRSPLEPCIRIGHVSGHFG